MSYPEVHIYEYPSEYGGVYSVRPFLNIYANNSNLCVGFECFNKEDGFWEPFCYATTNIISLAYLEGIIDVNDNGTRMLEFLESNGFGECTPYSV